MKILLLLMGVLALISPLNSINAETAYNLEFKVTEIENKTNNSVLVYIDSLAIAANKSYQVFTGPLTISIYTLRNYDDSLGTQIELTTLSPTPKISAKELNIFKGRDFEMTIEGMSDNKYEIGFSTLSRFDFDPDTIRYNWRDDESIHFLYNYKTGTMGDFHLEYFAAYLEYIDKGLKATFRMYYPSKIGFTFYDDFSPSMYWDKTLPVSLDPQSRRIAMVYTNEIIPQAATLTMAYHLYANWGYSHPFAVWGAAGYFDEPHFFATKMLTAGKRLDPAKYFKPRMEWGNNSEKYLPIIGSFAKFLIDRYGADVYRRFYESLTDLSNIKTSIFEYFGVSYETIRKDWLKQLSSYDPGKANIAYYAHSQYDALANFNRALPMFAYLYHKDQYDDDSGIKFALSLYCTGKYRGASEVFERMLVLIGETVQYHYLLGNSYYSDGKYEKAEKNYLKALEMDSTYSQAYFKLGNIYLDLGKTKDAEKNLMYALGYAPDGGIYSEIYFKWSESIRKLGDVHKSDSLNSLGLYFARTRVAGSPSVLIYWLLLGEAYIYSDIADSALTHLQIVEKNENRKYYIGRNFLAMGKAYDLMGKRDEAKKYYKNVLDNRSAVYHKREAEKLLKTQYKLYDY